MKTNTDDRSFILKPSTISGGGVGVFALHDIVEGTHMALFTENFQEEICKPEEVPEELQGYCLDQPDGTILCPKNFNQLDIGNYLNHSVEHANLRYEAGKGYFSTRSIHAGEELFADYRELGEPENNWDDYYQKKS